MRILDTFRPTKTQKQVIAKIAGAATPTVANDAVSMGTNTVAARDALIKLGLIAVNGGEVSLTDTGMQLAVAENITDESGGLTPEGQTLATSEEVEQAPDVAPQQPQLPMESFSTLKSLLW